MKKRNVIVGTRGSELALKQAHIIVGFLENAGLECKVKTITTSGDMEPTKPISSFEGSGFFTKEVENALLRGKIDVAVHSFKDIETAIPDGLKITAITVRADAADMIIIRKDATDTKRKFGLKAGAVVGTSSPRRRMLLHSLRSDLWMSEIRGNVPTRIEKLRNKEYDAIVLAAAGLERLGVNMEEFYCELLDPHEFVPAAAQGSLAVQIRSDDKELELILSGINDINASEVTCIEKDVMKLLNAGCLKPLGVYCEKNREENTFKAWVASSENWKKSPARFYFTSLKSAGFAEKIAAKIHNAAPCSVFITRDMHPKDLFFRTLADNGYKTNGISLIEIKKVPVAEIPKTDWIFFSSKDAVKYFFEQCGNGENKVLYGAIGKSTAANLRNFGKRAEFIGYSTNTVLTGKQFAAMTGSSKVLFPQSRGSLRTIQQQFVRQELVHDLIVYETKIKADIKIPDSDILFFTSPSNVNAFLIKNKIRNNQKVIAMGDATGSVLRHHGFNDFATPASFSEIGMLEAVFGIGGIGGIKF